MSKHHVTARVPEDVYEALEDVREAERMDRSTAIVRLLERGIEAWRVDTAVSQYRDDEVSLGKAAEIADVSVWKFLDILDERDVGVRYDESDLEADLAALDAE